MSVSELPEYQVFTILRKGEESPIGPYSQNQIVELLNEGKVRQDDLIYYEGLGDWQPLGSVFAIHEGIANFEDDGQDRELVGEVFLQLSDLVTEDEEVYYIAIQDKPGLRIKGPDAIAVTSIRLCIAHQKLNGKREFDMYYWDEVHNTTPKLVAGEEVGTFSVLLRAGERIEIPRLPRRQLQRVAELSREMRSTGEVTI